MTCCCACVDAYTACRVDFLRAFSWAAPFLQHAYSPSHLRCVVIGGAQNRGGTARAETCEPDRCPRHVIGPPQPLPPACTPRNKSLPNLVQLLSLDPSRNRNTLTQLCRHCDHDAPIATMCMLTCVDHGNRMARLMCVEGMRCARSCRRPSSSFQHLLQLRRWKHRRTKKR